MDLDASVMSTPLCGKDIHLSSEGVTTSSLFFHAVNVSILGKGPRGSLIRGSVVFLDRHFTEGIFNRRGPVKGALGCSRRFSLAIGKVCTGLPRGTAVGPRTIVSVPAL